MNSSGRLFRVSLLGESHGPCVGVLVDGCPPGLPLSPDTFEADLARRRPGAPGTTPRAEEDLPEILSGVYEGKSAGTPILLLFRNRDAKSADYARFADLPRPGHADFAALLRYAGFADPRGGGHFSGRLTAGLVAAGSIAKLILQGARFDTRLVEVGGKPMPATPPGAAAESVERAVAEAVASGDSVGGIVELRVSGLAAGLGEPFFDSVESVLSHTLFAVPGVRGVEFGDGFAAARMRGSEHNDAFVSADGRTGTNHSGGVNGGILNGNDLVVRVAVKPTSTIARPQLTYDLSKGAMGELAGSGRHDACIAIRAAVALEAALAIALADLALLAATRSAMAGHAPEGDPPATSATGDRT